MSRPESYTGIEPMCILCTYLKLEKTRLYCSFDEIEEVYLKEEYQINNEVLPEQKCDAFKIK